MIFNEFLMIFYEVVPDAFHDTNAGDWDAHDARDGDWDIASYGDQDFLGNHKNDNFYTTRNVCYVCKLCFRTVQPCKHDCNNKYVISQLL